MRVTKHSPATNGLARSGRSRFALQLGILLLALAVGFIAGQQGWQRPLADFGAALLRDPSLALTAPFRRADLPTLTVDLRFRDYQQLLDRRAVALQTGVNRRDDTAAVPATLQLDGTSVTADLQLAEGPATALSGTTWPLTVHVRDTISPWGCHDFTLTPADSSALNTWGYLTALRQAGLLAPHYELLHLILNGTAYGLYALEELPGADFLAGQPAGRRLIAFDASAAWIASASFPDALSANSFRYAQVELLPAAAPADPTREAAIRLVQALLAGERVPATTFNADRLGTFLALTTLWRGTPTLDWRAIRFAYDPETGQLDPIGTGRSWTPTAALPAAFTADPTLQLAYARALEQISRPETLARLQTELGPELEQLQRAVSLDLGYPGLPWTALQANQVLMRRQLTPERPLFAYAMTTADTLVISVGNLQPFPLELMGIDVGESAFVPADPAWVDAPDSAVWSAASGQLVLRGATGATPHFVRLQIPRAALAGAGSPDQLRVITRLFAVGTTDIAVPVQTDYPLPGEVLQP